MCCCLIRPRLSMPLSHMRWIYVCDFIKEKRLLYASMSFPCIPRFHMRLHMKQRLLYASESCLATRRDLRGAEVASPRSQHMYVYVCIYIYIQIHICICICVYVYMCIYIYIYICVCMYVCVYIYIYIYIYLLICLSVL